MTLSLNPIADEYRKLCDCLNVDYPFRTGPRHDGSAHVEIVGDEYCFVVTERGEELKRRRTRDPDELLYWLMYDVVFDLAVKFELANRIEGQDFRRVLFSKEVELMQRLNPSWAKRTEDHIRNVLRSHPFADQIDA